MKNTVLLLASLTFGSLGISGCAGLGESQYTLRWSPSQATQMLALSNGFTLRYLRTGSGPPLVLLHPLRTQLDYFERLVPLLSPHYQVYVVDLPGHGRSSILPVDYTEELFRQSVGEFIDKLNLQNVVLVGESIGGVLALTVAAERPERVSRVVALNPYDYGENFGGGIRRSRNGWIIGLFNIFGKYTIEPRFVLSAVLKGGLHDPSKLPGELLSEFHRTGHRADYRSVEYSSFRNWSSWLEARANYPHINMPVLLAYSSDDWSRPEEREENRLAIKTANLVIIEDSGHFAALERPDAVARLILSPGS